LFGGLIGLAIGATAFSSTFAASMNSMAAGLPEQLAVLRDASQAIGFIPQLKTLNLDPALISPVLDSYDMAWRTVWYALTGLAVTGCVLAFFTQELSLENEEEGKQGLQ
jgi:hypothetical protein